jgi:NADP-dependent 3-hydroxy acid dehydrogenase YdfG
MTTQIILVTGAPSGFGQMSANALAHAGHVIYVNRVGFSDLLKPRAVSPPSEKAS